MLAIRDVSLAYDDTVVVDHLDLAAADGEVVCIVGPSGCGRTSARWG